MTPGIVGLTLFAAILHAAWNALLRSGAERLWSITIMSFATTAFAIPLSFVLPLPLPSSWSYLALSSALQVGYSVFLVHAYRYGGLAQVYPIIRGSVPLLVTVGGLLWTTQPLSRLGLMGVVLIALGIMSLALGNSRAGTRSVILALVTSLLIAGYVTINGLGARLSGDPRSYATWIFLIYGLLMPATFVALRGNLKISWRSPETLKATAGGIVSLISYAATVSALALGPVGQVSALRETAVVFALLIGCAFLGERLTLRRLCACAAVALGAVCTSYR